MFCTNGVLLRRLTSPGADKMLESLSHIVIDELHERDLFADFLTIVLRGVLARHPHLRLVLMSATVREDLFSEYFGGCPVIRVPGYTHPVADYHLEDILSLVGYGGGGGGGVHDFVHTATADPDGPEGQATQAAVMRAFLEGTDESFDSLLDTVRGVGSTSGVEERALVGVAHAGTGATALMAAAGKGRHMEVSQLIGMGADPTQRSRDGSSSADWARRFGHEDIAQTLDAAEEQIKRLSAMENASAQMSQYQIQADPDEVDIQLAQELIHWILTHRAGEMQTRDGGPAGPDAFARASATACTRRRECRPLPTFSSRRCSGRRSRSCACRCACSRRRPASGASVGAARPPWGWAKDPPRSFCSRRWSPRFPRPSPKPWRSSRTSAR